MKAEDQNNNELKLMLIKHTDLLSEELYKNKQLDEKLTQKQNDIDELVNSLKESTSLASTLQIENVNLMAENARLKSELIELNKQLKK